MQEFVIHELEGERLFLLPERALWWPDQEMLIVADVHLGKATHLNKAGQALPNNRALRDLNFLTLLTRELAAKRVLILGDLFHSDPNSEFLLLREFCKNVLPARVELVLGNHDIAGRSFFEGAGITVHDDPYCFPPFCFTHDAAVLQHRHELYILSGHVHPGIKLYGKARQSLRIPCFYFGNDYGLLPAFGSLTGLFSLDYENPEDVFYGIAGERIVRIPAPVRS